MKKLLMAVTLLVPTVAGVGALAGTTPSYAARPAGHNGTKTATLPPSNDVFTGVQFGDTASKTLAVTGTVTAMTTASLTLTADKTSQVGTFALTSNTKWAMQYKGTSYIAPLMVGSHVQVDWTASSMTATMVILLAS